MDDDDGSGLCVYMHIHEDIGYLSIYPSYYLSIYIDMDDDDGSGLCVYMHRHEDIGFWKATSCSREMASICEYPR